MAHSGVHVGLWLAVYDRGWARTFFKRHASARSGSFLPRLLSARSGGVWGGFLGHLRPPRPHGVLDHLVDELGFLHRLVTEKPQQPCGFASLSRHGSLPFQASLTASRAPSITFSF